MAIASVNAVYSATGAGQGPGASSQILSQPGLSPQFGQSVVGYAQASLDGTATSFVVNFIDGTASVFPIPLAVLAFRAEPCSSAPTVAVSTVYKAGDRVNDGTNIQEAIVGGTSAATAPTYATTIGKTTTDGSVTWKLIAKPDTAAATIYVQSTSAVSNTGFTVTISAAGTNGQLLTVAFLTLKG